MDKDKTIYKWGAYRGHKQHLFPESGFCVMSLCEKAYGGDGGVNFKSQAKKCAFCKRLESQAGRVCVS